MTSAPSSHKSIPVYDRAGLKASVVGVLHRGRSAWHPNVYEITLNGHRAVWKDIGEGSWIARRVLGPVLKREARVLRRLDEMASVPRLVGLGGDCGYVMEKLEADRLPHRHENSLSPAFFDALRAEIAGMHRLGVTHGDLRRLNILVERWTGRPKLIDFGTAVMQGQGDHFVKRSIWRKSRRIDWMHFAKIKHSYFPNDLDEQERRWLAYAPWHYRLGHFYRWRIYKPLKRLARRKRRLGA